MEATTVIRRPLLTEKNTDAAELNRYVFEVDRRARKPQIRQAIVELYGVRVESVSTIRRKGKTRRTRWGYRYTGDVKKAIVKVHPEDRIEFF
ncbi:MAG: 50S ribosomal protein L23 [Planctomycetes bacterium]|nr:50S ribosomal protein L23 [Planctomycetota bacterium]NOG54829.1 50S ribosomal protein L23 [Planctomycetota bacterium]